MMIQSLRLTSGFILKTQFNTEKSCLERKINDIDKKVTRTNKLVKRLD